MPVSVRTKFSIILAYQKDVKCVRIFSNSFCFLYFRQKLLARLPSTVIYNIASFSFSCFQKRLCNSILRPQGHHLENKALLFLLCDFILPVFAAAFSRAKLPPVLLCLILCALAPFCFFASLSTFIYENGTDDTTYSTFMASISSALDMHGTLVKNEKSWKTIVTDIMPLLNLP